MHYELDDVIERVGTIILKGKLKTKTLYIREPSVYNLIMFEKLLSKQRYIEAYTLICPEITKYDLASNPKSIQKAIADFIYPQKTNNNGGEEGFFPATIDFIAQRYSLHPMDVLKKFTFSQLDYISEGIEYNGNIESGKPEKNSKFKMRISKDQENEFEELKKAHREHY